MQRKRRTRRLWTLPAATLCVLLGMGSFAIGNLAGAAGRRSSSVTISFLNYYTGSEVTVLNHQLIPKFEQQNPGIKVKSIIVPYGNLLPKFLAGAAAA